MAEFTKVEGTYFKADLELTFKNLIKQHDGVSTIDIYDFFSAVEKLCTKLYKEYEDMQLYDKVQAFIEAATPFFEEFIQQQ